MWAVSGVTGVEQHIGDSQENLAVSVYASYFNLVSQSAMVSAYGVAIILVLSCWAVRWCSIPRVDDNIVSEVIFGVKDGDDSQLPPVFGHRGCALDAPENTLAAFKEAKKNNADGIEFDLTFTRDNVAVIFHDDTLERTTNGEGPIDNITFDELRRLDASCKHPLAERFPKERVPTLEEGVEECLRLGMRLIIDVKRYDSRAVEVVDKLFRERPELYRRALVASFYHNFVYSLRRRNPGIVTALTWQPGVLTYEDVNKTRPYHESFFAHMLYTMADWLLDKALHSGFLPYMTGASVVMISDNMMSNKYVNAWYNRGVYVITWTTNNLAAKDFYRQSLRVGVITDTMHPA
ncbi:hypothetical protein HPB51_024436 [Rhipicephalus microplus]|uniref:GP-PDE domain-containing protein n=1 Tax=Rhipicephalus microplus TaxID=6941 RepID=A0A9J6D7J2_RHIMP|nr:hypothetical protein HPB51_024436 [Rhipicephalus microplus]